MAIFGRLERKNGIQLGTLGDECMHCKMKNRNNEDYEPESLQYKEVFKVWIHNASHCLCMNCFQESLGKYILVDPVSLEVTENIIDEEVVEEKQPPKKKANSNSKKKEEEESK